MKWHSKEILRAVIETEAIGAELGSARGKGTKWGGVSVHLTQPCVPKQQKLAKVWRAWREHLQEELDLRTEPQAGGPWKRCCLWTSLEEGLLLILSWVSETKEIGLCSPLPDGEIGLLLGQWVGEDQFFPRGEREKPDRSYIRQNFGCVLVSGSALACFPLELVKYFMRRSLAKALCACLS